MGGGIGELCELRGNAGYVGGGGKGVGGRVGLGLVFESCDPGNSRYGYSYKSSECAVLISYNI